MTYNEKVDLFRYIGESLYEKYKINLIKRFPEYDTSKVRPDTDINKLVHEEFISPYTKQESVTEENMNELQYVLAVIRNSIVEYDKIKTRDLDDSEKAMALTVDKALSGEKGTLS